MTEIRLNEEETTLWRCDRTFWMKTIVRALYESRKAGCANVDILAADGAVLHAAKAYEDTGDDARVGGTCSCAEQGAQESDPLRSGKSDPD